MAVRIPKPGAYVGSTTKLDFDVPVTGFTLRINGQEFHPVPDASGYTLALNNFGAGVPLVITVGYPDGPNPVTTETITVTKPPHDYGGMGATVKRDGSGNITGTFFKFWLPQVKMVYIRGSFNQWRDTHRLEQLGNSGYWYGFVEEARPGHDYKFFVYTFDGKAQEVSDPAARQTMRTSHNSPDDARDANGVVVDPAAFRWLYNDWFADRRRDFSKHIVYQVHWGTFLRKDNEGLSFKKFADGATEAEKRLDAHNRLSYISGLNFTAIELLPVHEANGNADAGYNPSFLFAVESTCGTPDDLRILVDEAHKLGLAVLFDSVINHLTDDAGHSSFSQDFIKGWYINADAPYSNHRLFPGDRDWGPDPDFDRPEIRNLLLESLRMYFDEFRVDGIRFDATTTIPAGAIKEMIGALQHEYGAQGKYLVAEHITNDPFPYIIDYAGFNASWYDNAFYAALALLNGNVDRGTLYNAFENYHWKSPTTVIHYLTGSHDKNWAKNSGAEAFIWRFGGPGNTHAVYKLRLAWALSVCTPGVPMLFMGTERMAAVKWDNYQGYNGNGTNAGMDWFPAPPSTGGQVLDMIRSINELHTEEGAFRGGHDQCALVHTDYTNHVFAYRRWDSTGSVLLIIMNFSGNEWKDRSYGVRTDLPGSTWREVFNSQAQAWGGWSGWENDPVSFRPKADRSGLLQGINLPKWGLVVLKQQ